MRRTQPHGLGAIGFATLLACGVLAVAVGCGEQGGPTGSAAPVEPAADVSRADVLADGLPRVDLAALETLVERTAGQGRVLVLDFWATWCGACVAIFGDVHERLGALGEDVRLVTVSLDVSHEETRAINFLAEHRALNDAYMLRPDSATRTAVEMHLGERWQHLALPAILVFDARGDLAREFIGEEAEPGRIAEYVEQLLAHG